MLPPWKDRAMNIAAVLALGFFLGMRHATDSDHVVAVSAIVSRERSLRAALPIGILWGLGHTLTLFAIGGAIVLLGIVIPPYLGLGMEFCVALMLLLLGGLNICTTLRGTSLHDSAEASPMHAPLRLMRPFAVGIVHGLAGSAAIALLVLGAIREPLCAVGYLLVFGFGTVVGMLAITVALAWPLAALVRRFERFHGVLGFATGLASVAFGAVLAYRVGFVHGLFSGHPAWTPE